jgi:hypothetical protein
MGLQYDTWVPEDKWTYPEVTPFTIHPREIDCLIENVLAVEVQGSGKYLHEKPLRRRKDAAKRSSIEARGLGWTELWDEELRLADQKKAGLTWRPKIKELLELMLPWSRFVHHQFLQYKASIPEIPKIDWPGVGLVRIDKRRD